MKLSYKFHLFSFSILMVMTLSVLVAGTQIINELTHNLQSQVLHSELMKIRQTVFEALQRSGVRAAARTTAVLQANLKKTPHQMQHVHIFIIEAPDRAVFHSHYKMGERIEWADIQPMFQQRAGDIEYTNHGVLHYAVFTTIAPLEWLICLSIDKDEMYAKRKEYLCNIGLIAAVVLGISALVVSLLVNRFVRRLQVTLGCVKQIEKGALETRIHPITVNDEIGRLQSGVNAMSARIQARTIEQQQAEQALKKSEAKYMDLYEHAPDMYVSVNTKTAMIEACNMTLVDHLGVVKEEIIGRPVVELYHPDCLEEVKNAFARLVEVGEVIDKELQLRTKDGSTLYVSLNASAVFCENGQIHISRCTLRDITDRKRVEEELKRHRDHLEELVQNRTQALSEANTRLLREVTDRMKITRKLEAANKELEAFAYSVSHDLRAPLRHIDGFLDLLERQAGVVLDEKSRYYMDTISGAANKMGQLIDDLLAFSRMGRHALSVGTVDLNPMVEEIIEQLAPDTAGRTIDWRIGDLPTVEGDAAMLNLVLGNLIANANQVHPAPGTGPHRDRHAARSGFRDSDSCARQRCGFRYGLCGQALRRVPAPAPYRRIRGHGHRPGHRAAHHRPARWPHLGRGKSR